MSKQINTHDSGFNLGRFVFHRVSLFVVLTSILCSSLAMANAPHFKPLVLFQGTVQQGSYLQVVDMGIQRFEEKTGITVERIQLQPDHDIYLDTLEKAAKEGFSPIIVQESNAMPSFPELARRYPSTQFISLDVSYHVPNILGLTFNHAEGSYVIGYLSGLKTTSGKIGFIGGMDIPVINDFNCGFQLGVKDANPTATVESQYINNGAFSWEDVQGAKSIAQDMLDSDIDIIFPVAGYASLGVVDSVKQHGQGYSFGIDYDYSNEYPNTTLASLEKKADVAVYAALMQLKNGIWNGNQKQFGIKHGVIAISVNEENPNLTQGDKQAIRQLLLQLKGKSSVISQQIDEACTHSL